MCYKAWKLCHADRAGSRLHAHHARDKRYDDLCACVQDLEVQYSEMCEGHAPPLYGPDVAQSSALTFLCDWVQEKRGTRTRRQKIPSPL